MHYSSFSQDFLVMKLELLLNAKNSRLAPLYASLYDSYYIQCDKGAY
jgi:hypothetical protein